MIITLLVASSVVFFVLEILPGDPAAVMLGINAEDDTLAALRAELGLDRPIAIRYLGWLGDLVQGDLGISYTYDVPVSELIMERVILSLPLAVLSMILSTLIAIPLGIIAASNHTKPMDFLVMIFSQLGIAIPNFWFALLLIIFFFSVYGIFASWRFCRLGCRHYSGSLIVITSDYCSGSSPGSYFNQSYALLSA